MKKFLEKLKERKKFIGVTFIVVLMVCLFGFMLVAPILQSSSDNTSLISYNEYKELIKEGKVESVTIRNYTTTMDLELKEKDEKDNPIVKKTLRLNHDKFMEDLLQSGVTVNYKTNDVSNSVSSVAKTLPSMLLMLLMIVYIIVIVNMIKGKSKGKNKNGTKSKITFKDVAGLTEEKVELQSVIDSFVNADKYKEHGGRPIKGVLLTGPPGTGKTLLAQAVAGEADVNFLPYAGSDFVEMLVGRGASRVRSMFDKAKRLAPCVIFIDEIDQVGRKRMDNGNAGTQESDQTLTAILDRLNGADFDMEGILLIGATNKAHLIDDALIRPNRIDKVIEVGIPRNKEDRKEIVTLHAKNKKLADTVSLDDITKVCYGMSGAEIELVLSDAVSISFMEGKEGIIELSHIDKAFMKMLSKGVAKKKPSKEETYVTAVHEAGHVIMDLLCGRKLTKVSIIPYSGGIGGVTVLDGDSVNLLGCRTKEDYINDIKSYYGGVLAEKVIIGKMSSGCSNDLDRATSIISTMLGSYGMCGSLVAYDTLAKTNPLVTSNDSYLNSIRLMSKNIEKEVLDLFNKPEIKGKIIKLAEELIEKETIYNISNIDDI